MSARRPVFKFPIEEYLEMEKTSPVRHEYLAGQIYAMARASKRHNQIALNCASKLRTHLRSKGRVFMSDIKLHIEELDTFYYPDVVVSGDLQDDDQYVIKRPTLIIEVLSESTAATDRREKALAYQRINGLQEYILIAQDESKIELYRRDAKGQWWYEELSGDNPLKLESVDLEMTMDEIYEET
jgi:Uma2 family endonuclease